MLVTPGQTAQAPLNPGICGGYDIAVDGSVDRLLLEWLCREAGPCRPPTGTLEKLIF